MKMILLCTALTVAVSTGLQAQNSPNREGIGGVPDTAPASPGGTAPSRGKDQQDNDSKASDKSPDERFIHKAGKAGKMEVKMAEKGLSKATREDLKSFSAMLVKDHNDANTELAGIAKSLGVEIPDPESEKEHRKTDAGAPDSPKKAAEAEKHMALEEKSGTDFDAVYMQIMYECHAKDIALFEKAEGEVKSPELKGFITKTLPVLKKHAAALAALNKKDSSPSAAKEDSSAQPSAGTSDPATRRDASQVKE